MATPKSKRTYNSTRRQEQARQTRIRIIEAAHTLFIQRGYAGATVDAIAQQAGVASETVYAAFGSKHAILSQLLDISLVGDDQPVPLLKRAGPQSVIREKDQLRQLELFVEDMYGIMSRASPVLEILRVAAKTEPEIAAMYQTVLDNRKQGMMVFVRALVRNGPLRESLSLSDAAETVWTLTSAEVFTLLNTTLGWHKEKYQRWLADGLRRLLLP